MKLLGSVILAGTRHINIPSSLWDAGQEIFDVAEGFSTCPRQSLESVCAVGPFDENRMATKVVLVFKRLWPRGEIMFEVALKVLRPTPDITLVLPA